MCVSSENLLEGMFKKSVFVVCFLLAAFGAFIYFGPWEKEFRIPKSKSTIQKDGKGRDLILGETDFRKTSKKDSVFKPYLKKQWALKDIGVVKAWKYTEGQGVVIAVCDTGIHPKHPCLKPNLWVNKKEVPNNGIDDDKNGYVDDIHGWNFVDNNNDIQDRHGHGTHISGIIAATGKTKAAPACKVRGVAPRVKIMTLKYYDMENGENNIKNTVKCVNYAINNGAHIINYSGGGPGANDLEEKSIVKANDQRIIFVAASGNEGEEIKKDLKYAEKFLNPSKNKNLKYYPASYNLPNILSVNSRNSQDILESSNRMKINWLQQRNQRKKIHSQTAPGARILSTLPPKRYVQSSFFKNMFRGLASKVRRSIPETFFDFLPHALRNIAKARPDKHNNYGYMTGTSQATGIVSGLAALIKSRYSNWSYLQIIKQIDETGYSSKTQNIKQKTNQGKVLNAHEAISMRDRIPLTDIPESTGRESSEEVGIEKPIKKKDFREENAIFGAGEAMKKALQKKMKSK